MNSKKIISVFPNTQAEASYNMIKQYILINSVERRELENCSISRKREVMKIARHEIQHYLDHIATLWGRTHLIKTYDAIRVFQEEKDSDFHTIYSYYKNNMHNKLNEYYSTKCKKDILDGRPWKYSYSAGLRFDSQGRLDEEKPVLMTLSLIHI